MTETLTLPALDLDPLARMIADCEQIRLVAAAHPASIDLTVPAPRRGRPVIDITDSALALADAYSDYGC